MSEVWTGVGVAALVAFSAPVTVPAAPASSWRASFRDLELSWIDLRVDADPVEGCLLDRLARDGPPEAERPLHAVDVTEIAVIHPVFDRLALGEGLPHQHHGQGRVSLDDEPGRE